MVDSYALAREVAQLRAALSARLTPTDAVVETVDPLVLRLPNGDLLHGAVAVGTKPRPSLPVTLLIGSGRALVFPYVGATDPYPGELTETDAGRITSLEQAVETIRSDALDVSNEVGEIQREPAQVTGLSVGSTPYLDAEGVTQGRLTASWNPVLTATEADGEGGIDLAGYELSIRRNEIGAPWTTVRLTETTSAEHSPLPPGVSYQVRVRALAKIGGIPGEWSASATLTIAGDTTPPPTPSQPSLSQRLSVVTVTWDGLAAGGGSGIPADYHRTEVAVGPTATPTDVVTYLTRAGDTALLTGIPYQTTYYVRLRSLDRSGNASGWSTAVTIEVQPLVDADLIETTIQSQLDTLDGQVTQAFIDITAVEGLANQATLDAQDAHNAAVQAQDDLLVLAGKTGRLIRSATAPIGADQNVNNLWLDTDNGQLHEWTGSAWVVITDSRLTDAAAAAATAQQAADDAQATASQLAQDMIVNQVIEYAVNASETVPPVSGWSTSTPTRTPGSYIWMRTQITYGDASTATSSPVLVTGNDGADGAPGAAAATVTLTATAQVLTAPAGGGATTPVTSVVTGVAANTTITAWTYSVNGGAFSATVPAGASRTGNVVTLTGSTMTARTIAVKMADANGVADTLTVALVLDGAAGGTGASGYTVLLTNQSHTFPGTTSAAVAGSTTSTVKALKGTVAQNATIGTITGQVTGLTTSIASNGTTAPVITVTVTTALVTQNGVLTIPITVDGQSFTQFFSWSVSYTGAPGSTGATGVGISSVTTYFLQQPSAEAAPATPSASPPANDPVGNQPWVTTEPAYVAGTVLYRTERVIYTNATFAYTPPSKVSAYDAAVLALVSANGRNSIIRSISAASGTTHPGTGLALVVGDLWWQWDNTTDRRVIGQWTWNGSAWQATTINHQVISSIDADVITVGTLSADRLGAKSITAEKLLIGDFSNLWRDTAFALSYTPWTLTTGALQKVGTGALHGAYFAHTSIGVLPGDKIVGGFTDTRSGSTPTTGTVTLYMERQAASTGVWSAAGALVANPTGAGTATVASTSAYTVPADTQALRFGFYTESNMPSTTTSRITQVWVGKQVPAVLIQNGAVTADKVVSNESWANFVSGLMASFDTAFINQLQADFIEAGSYVGHTIEGAVIISRAVSDPTSYVKIEDRTIEFWRAEESGEIITTSLGGLLNDQLQLADSTGAVGVAFDGATGSGALTGHLDVDSLSIAGEDIGTVIGNGPKGLLTILKSSGDSDRAGSSELGYIRLDADVSSDRYYRLSIGGIIAVTTANDRFRVWFKTWDGGAWLTLHMAQVDVPTTTGRYFYTETIFKAPLTASASFYITFQNATANRAIFWSGRYNYPVVAMLEDLGAAAAVGEGVFDQWGGTPLSGGTNTNETGTITYVKEYTATWQRSWRGGSIVSDYLHQGYYGGLQRYSMVGFGGTLASDLSGATILKVEAYVENVHWWGASGTILVGSSTDTSAPASPVTSGTTAATVLAGGAKTYVPVGGFTTSSRAITIGAGASTSTAYYGKFKYTGVKLRVTYRK